MSIRVGLGLVCVLVVAGCGGAVHRGTTPASREAKLLYVPVGSFALDRVASFRVLGADGRVYEISAANVTLVDGRYVFDIPVAFDTGSLVYVFEDGTEGTYAFDEDDLDLDGDGVVDAMDGDDDGDGTGDLDDLDDDGDGVAESDDDGDGDGDYGDYGDDGDDTEDDEEEGEDDGEVATGDDDVSDDGEVAAADDDTGGGDEDTYADGDGANDDEGGDPSEE